MDLSHDPVMTVVGELYVLCCTQSRLLISSSEEKKDARAADKRHDQQLAAERRAEQMAYLKGLFIPAWSWMTSPFRAAASSEEHTALILDQPPLRFRPPRGNLKVPGKDL